MTKSIKARSEMRRQATAHLAFGISEGLNAIGILRGEDPEYARVFEAYEDTLTKLEQSLGQLCFINIAHDHHVAQREHIVEHTKRTQASA